MDLMLPIGQFVGAVAVPSTTVAAKHAPLLVMHPIDYVVLAVYLLFVVGIGVLTGRKQKTSEDFFLSGRSIPSWITGLAFISANLGALEVMEHRCYPKAFGRQMRRIRHPTPFKCQANG